MVRANPSRNQARIQISRKPVPMSVWAGHSCPSPFPLILVLQVWVGHSCPTLLTLGLGLPLPLPLQLQVWVGHSCPTLLTLRLGLLLPLPLILGLPLPLILPGTSHAKAVQPRPQNSCQALLPDLFA